MGSSVLYRQIASRLRLRDGSGLQKAMPQRPADSVKKPEDACQGNGLLMSAISVWEISILHAGLGDTNASGLAGAMTGTS
jgi:hypothetical protein